ncbi:isoprenylcysteine carboxylmethyltransferase family protein [Actinomadura sp. ATCC 31491]|uniref:Isoprenylcysteine carboxylmethyltransferase family protein n=1 Tax=Actinomadura luzonensis TaxID=2805427 RepID=A0ABT0G3C9_9ACTN|nr:isoprenylcysteine carboxylmethyltransferase family protein [Actinomadura luzonensis]MCK2219111.1 isoprenylcysteine carboxylmethyltransferase family protein [Actinomadura luzonensis]
MRRTPAALVSSLFFAAAPGTVAVLVPYWISGWQARDPFPAPVMIPLRAAGAVLAVAGLAVLVSAFVRFVVEGLGTPLPAAPPERLVVGGLYRYVRNPMYVAVLAAVAGQAMIFGDAALLLYAAVVAVPVWSFVHWYEEPHLRRQFGAAYEEYCAHVPGWLPRLRPYHS